MEDLTAATPNNCCKHDLHYNIETARELGKSRGGIRRLTDTSRLPRFCQSQFGAEDNFVG